MNILKSNKRRANFLIFLMLINLFLEVVCFISGYMQLKLLKNILKGIEVNNADIAWNDARELLIITVYFIVHFITIISFLLWFRRAYSNLHQLVPKLSYNENWALFGWFVPFINLIRPYKIMHELHFKAQEILVEKKQTFDFSKKKLLNWWILCLLFLSISLFMIPYSNYLESIHEVINITALGMFLNFLGFVVTWKTFRIIKKYSKVESVLYNLEIKK